MGKCETAVLSELRRKLSEFKFNEDRPAADASGLLQKIGAGKSGKHVTLWVGAGCMCATMFYGGKSNVIARVKGASIGPVQTIGRIADAACLYFWKYRKLAASTPEQTHFNFPISYAETDLKSEPALREIFQAMESEMCKVGYLTTENTKSLHERVLDLEKQIARLNATIFNNGESTNKQSIPKGPAIFNNASGVIGKHVEPSPVWESIHETSPKLVEGKTIWD